jgi:hypothetical protein
LYDDSCHTKRHRKSLWKKETKRSVSKCVVYLSYGAAQNLVIKKRYPKSKWTASTRLKKKLFFSLALILIAL